MTDFTETPVQFGAEGALLGILTLPLVQQSEELGCIVLNTGVNHRVGPHRINVKASRALAGIGIPTLRFDLSGIGDSASSQSALDFRAQAIDDMKSALDHLEKSHGLKRFLVFGICSGAENSIALALNDPRVVGLLAFDGPTYMTPGVRLERKLRRWMAFPFNTPLRHSYKIWADLSQWAADARSQGAKNSVAALKSILFPKKAEPVADIFADGAPEVTAQDFERKLLSLVDRGVSISLMYSATQNSHDRDYGMLRQLRGSRLFERAQYRFWPDIDHTATTLEMQARLLAALQNWARGLAFERPATRAGNAGGGTSQPMVLARRRATRATVSG